MCMREISPVRDAVVERAARWPACDRIGINRVGRSDSRALRLFGAGVWGARFTYRRRGSPLAGAECPAPSRCPLGRVALALFQANRGLLAKHFEARLARDVPLGRARLEESRQASQSKEAARPAQFTC